ncbi:RNA polymerase sigma-70 factor [Mucilaginibacter sp. KACC 22773]|uniref:RNA polymerase sigma-70 factor n=1 Tax=Mucilaginibacter sp. KACC 22773 TaxID=3025671 RepID=UPI0023657BA2|nr:RNA polymerase sigma-70 factor [Mucilaginibacter sp. KACC 22773]WDF77118.1 RNA polymerase sigma-70 factor [Mucilaginibacter sp. KACC 22773]
MLNKDHILCSDHQLLKLLQEDSKEAFDLIYKRYWEQLFEYVANVVKDNDEAKDIVQELFVTLWLRRMELCELKSLKAYLFTAARNKGLTYIRDNISRNKYLESLTLFFDLEYDSVIQQMEANELTLFIDKEIAKLPPKMREVFILSRKENLSHKLISEKLKISDKTVKKQINNVLKHFRLKLAEKTLYLIACLTLLLK